MNEQEIEISRALVYLESVVEDHSAYLEELENLLVFPAQDIDFKRVEVILKRMRKIRRDLASSINIIISNIDKVNDKKLREEALGILSYFYLIGFNDEKDLLLSIKDTSSKIGYELDIVKDLSEIDELRSKMEKFSL
ncbi:MAG: hypothetical protein OWQ54_07425 [Sulfolobaceae archaeon]|nr:hypothetical protein [Sulfolobaceae archaeon]